MIHPNEYSFRVIKMFFVRSYHYVLLFIVPHAPLIYGVSEINELDLHLKKDVQGTQKQS